MPTGAIDQVWIQTFETNVRHLAQQGISRARPYVMERSVGGVNHNWERLATVDTEAKALSVLTPTPVQDNTWSRRVSLAQTQHTATTSEQEDIHLMLVDPNSNLAQSQAMAMKRAYDREIIDAATGTALDGDGVANPFPATQVVGDGLSPISFDMVTEVTEKFLENDIDPDMAKVFFISPVS